MTIRPFPRKIIFGSLLRARARVVPVFAALALAATLATALYNLNADLDAKLHREFRIFGPNLTIVGAGGASLASDTMDRVNGMIGHEDLAVARAFAVSQADDGSKVLVVGVGPGIRDLNPTWKLEGGSGDNFVGHKAWDTLHLDGSPIALHFRGKVYQLSGYGKLTTGGAEDERIHIPLTAFQEWTKEPVNVIDVRVSGKAAAVESTMARLQAALPRAHVQPLRQVTETQTAVFEKSSGLLAWSSALVVVVLLLCAVASLSASVLDRRRDFAVMRALGASLHTVRMLLMREIIFIAALAAAFGYIAGCALSAWIGEANFGTAVQPRLAALQWVFPATILAGVVSALWPQYLLARIQPAVLLKGE